MLELIVGSMFCGKSTELIRRSKRLLSIGKKLLIINSLKDTRCHDELQTHDKQTFKAIKVNQLNEIFLIPDYQQAEFIMIDEGQFFEDLVRVVHKIVFEDNKKCIIAGLDGDYQQKKFGNILDLVPICTKLDKLSGYCSICNDGTEAQFTIRKNDIVETELIGDKNEYSCVCWKHMVEYRKNIHDSLDLDKSYESYCEELLIS